MRSGSPVVSRGGVGIVPRSSRFPLVTRAVATNTPGGSPGGKSAEKEITYSFDQNAGTTIKKKLLTKKTTVQVQAATTLVTRKVVPRNGSTDTAFKAGPTSGPGPVFTIVGILACVAAADATFVGLGGLGVCSAPGVAAATSAVATAATLFAAQLWLRIGGASTAGTIATCLTYAFGSVLSIVFVQAIKASKECATAALAASAAVAAATFLASSISDRLTVVASTPAPAAVDDVLVAPTPGGMQGGPGLGFGPGQKGTASFTRLEALREMMLKEFNEESERLSAVEAERAADMTRVETTYKARVTVLEQEIQSLVLKNSELAVTAGKVAELEQIRMRMEADIAALKHTYDAGISALKAQVAGLQRTISDTEVQMTQERTALQAQLRAARGLYSAQQRLFDSEMSKYRAALDLSEQHGLWWKSEAARLEQKLQQRVVALEQEHAAAMSSTIASERASAQQALGLAVKNLQASHDSEMEAAIAQALGERFALQTLMEDRLTDAEKQRAADVKGAARAATAEAEVRVGLEWKRKIERLESSHAITVTAIHADYKTQLAAVADTSRKSEAQLRNEMAALTTTYGSNMSAATAAHTAALADAKKTAGDALAAAKSAALASLAAHTKATAAELVTVVAELKSEEEAMVAQLCAERDAAVAEARAELRSARAERGQLYLHFTTEAAKAEGIVRARLAVELANAEKNFEAFWQGEAGRLQQIHDDKVAEMEKNHRDEVVSLDAAFGLDRNNLLRDERAAAATNLEASLAAQMRAFEGDKRALKALMSSEEAKARMRMTVAVDEAVASGVAHLAAAEATHSTEKAALTGGFDAQMAKVRADFAAQLERELVRNTSEVEMVWKAKLAQAEKEAAAAIAAARAAADDEIAALRQNLVSSQAAHDEEVRARGQSAEKQLETAVAQLHAEMDALGAEHVRATADADVGYATALAAARAAAADALRYAHAERSQLYTHLSHEIVKAKAKGVENVATTLDKKGRELAALEATYTNQVQGLEATAADMAVERKAALAAGDLAKESALAAAAEEWGRRLSRREAELSKEIDALKVRYAAEVVSAKAALVAARKDFDTQTAGERNEAAARYALLETTLAATSSEYEATIELMNVELTTAKASAEQEMAALRTAHIVALKKLGDERDGQLAAVVGKAAGDAAADVERLSADLAAAKAKFSSEMTLMKTKHAEELGAALKEAADEMATAAEQMVALEKMRKDAIAAAEATLAEKLLSLEAKLAAVKNEAIEWRQLVRDAAAKAKDEMQAELEAREKELQGEIAAEKSRHQGKLAEYEQKIRDAAALAEKTSSAEVVRMAGEAEELRVSYEAQITSVKTEYSQTVKTLEVKVIAASADADNKVASVRAQMAAALQDAEAKSLAALAAREAELRVQIEELKAEAAEEVAAAKAAYDAALSDAKTAAAAEVKSAMQAAGADKNTLEALEAKYGSLERELAAARSAVDEAYATGKKNLEDALVAARDGHAAELAEAEEASAAAFRKEVEARKVALAKREAEAGDAAKAAEAAARAGLDEARTAAASELEAAMNAADADRAKLEELFRAEAARSRKAFEDEISLYDQRLLESSSTLTAEHQVEVQVLLTTHATQMSVLRTELEASAVSGSELEAQMNAMRADFESKFEALLQKHGLELDQAAAAAKAMLQNAERQASSTVAQARKDSELERMALVEKLEKQMTMLRVEVETVTESRTETLLQLNTVKTEKIQSEQKLSDLLELYGRERKVLEDTGVVARELDAIKKAYAMALNIDVSNLDPEDKAQRAELEKVGQAVAGGQRGPIPIWAYYALGVATALLPRILGGGLGL